MAAMQEKQVLMQSELSSLQTKYGVKSHREDVIVVYSPPLPPSKSVKQPPGKFTKEALKKRKETESEEDPDFEITPSPTKGPYPLGDFGMIGGHIGGRIGGSVAGRSEIVADRTSRRLVGMAPETGDGRNVYVTTGRSKALEFQS